MHKSWNTWASTRLLTGPNSPEKARRQRNTIRCLFITGSRQLAGLFDASFDPKKSLLGAGAFRTLQGKLGLDRCLRLPTQTAPGLANRSNRDAETPRNFIL
jgi:hypothetical protein